MEQHSPHSNSAFPFFQLQEMWGTKVTDPHEFTKTSPEDQTFIAEMYLLCGFEFVLTYFLSTKAPFFNNEKTMLSNIVFLLLKRISEWNIKVESSLTEPEGDYPLFFPQLKDITTLSIVIPAQFITQIAHDYPLLALSSLANILAQILSEPSIHLIFNHQYDSKQTQQFLGELVEAQFLYTHLGSTDDPTLSLLNSHPYYQRILRTHLPMTIPLYIAESSPLPLLLTLPPAPSDNQVRSN